ncbi:MAG: AmmeMemoRadiSam system protein A, partial [Proteobacteria bacterium]|nr:AmmeMemoRadiSam system protein A [Pseudomonadota bacterium]
MALIDNEKTALLRLARESIEERLTGVKQSGSRVDEITAAGGGALTEKRGAFVTLKSGEHLRGCIGTFSEEAPLYKTITEMAVSAATHDPRFMPVSIDELKELRIEISALTPLEVIDDVTEIEVGRHGIYITKGRASGVLLPQVATEHNLDRAAFLEALCQKAGLGPG